MAVNPIKVGGMTEGERILWCAAGCPVWKHGAVRALSGWLVHNIQEFAARQTLLALGLAAGFGVSSLPVPAQTTGSGTATISIEEARRIAAQNGISAIREIELDDGHWEIEGTDQAGNKFEMEIDARSGKVVKMERN